MSAGTSPKSASSLDGVPCLVTGATGVLGSYLVSQLAEEKACILAFARPESDTRHVLEAGASICRGDLRDPDSLAQAVHQAKVVFHLAEPGISQEDFAWVQDSAIRTIVKTSKDVKGFRRLVYVSSPLVGCHPVRMPACEDTPVLRAQEDPHTLAKRSAEALIHRAGVPATILRPTAMYGPGSVHFEKLFRFARRLGPLGIPFPGRKDILLPFIHLADAAQALVLAACQKGTETQTYIVTDDSRITLGDFFQALSGQVGIPLRLRRVPVSGRGIILRTLSRAGFKGKVHGLSQWLNILQQDIVFDNRRMKEELGVTLQYPSVHDGLEDMARSLRRSLGLETHHG